MSKAPFFGRITIKGKATEGKVCWVRDWNAWATVTELGANGPYDTKADAKAALRREMRGILEEEARRIAARAAINA